MPLPWPLPALLAWGASWLLFTDLRPRHGLVWALLAACALGTLASLWGTRWWRRVFIALGFPLSLAAGARVLDAGCGLGHGLRALRRAYPQAQWHGTEWSWPLALLCRLRCPWARVRRGDIWAEPWGGYQLVYLFQRPESMERAAAKAGAEMAAGSWLVSLGFPVPGAEPAALLPPTAGHPVWVYRLPLAAQAPMAKRK